MTKREKASFKNFSPRERSLHGLPIFQKYEEISYAFVKRVDGMVSYAKEIFGKEDGKFLVYDFNLLKHAANSYHYAINNHLCVAVDGAFEKLTPMESYFVISKFRFTGVGWYPDWNPIPGFHIDMRPKLIQTNWVAYKTDVGQKYNYDYKHFIQSLIFNKGHE